MNPELLRKKLEQAIKRQLPDELWNELVDAGYCHLEEEEWDEGFAELKRRALTFLRLGRDKAAKHPQQNVRKVPLREAEARRAEALSVFFSSLARPRAAKLRKWLLGGRTLTKSEMLAFLKSPAIAAFSPSWFRRHSVPLFKHRATFNEARSALYVAPPGKWFRLRGNPKGRVEYVTPDGWETSEAFWTRSVLSEVAFLSKVFMNRFGWEETPALGFILMGASPHLFPAKTTVSVKNAWVEEDSWATARITVSAQAWVSAETILRTYRKAQRELLGRENRQLFDRNLSVFEHVATQRARPGAPPATWRELMDDWNRRKGKTKGWQYVAVRLFHRDYTRARQALLHPKLQDPLTRKRSGR